MANEFFLIFVATIIVVRLFLFLKPFPAPTIGSFRTHHYMFGLLGLVSGIVFNSVIVCAIGMGLFVDELTYLLMGGKTHKDNYSKLSLVGTVFLAVLVFIFKDYLVSIL